MSTRRWRRVNGVEDGLIKRSSVVGFVPQDDVCFPTLTVRENVVFSAALRLQGDMHETRAVCRVRRYK